MIAKSLQRILNGQQKRFAAVVAELETGSLASARVPRLDGVVKTAGCANDWNSAVLEAVNLIQAAGFVLRGHEEHVTASFDLVGQRIVVGDLNGDLLRELFLHPGEHFFVLAITIAQGDHNQFLAGETVHDLGNQVEALLRRETRDDSDYWQSK